MRINTIHNSYHFGIISTGEKCAVRIDSRWNFTAPAAKRFPLVSDTL